MGALLNWERNTRAPLRFAFDSTRRLLSVCPARDCDVLCVQEGEELFVLYGVAADRKR